jgi:large subunit ribosomal protein L29
MNIDSLRELSRTELIQKRDELKEELFNLKMRRSIKTLDNPLRLRTIGREIAQVNTILREDDLKIRPLAEGKASILGDVKSRKSGEKK